MFRKLAIALAATATIGAAALAPTSASAHHRHYHYGWGAAAFGAAMIASSHYYAAPSCFVVRRWVATPHGMKLRRVWVC